MNFKKHFLPKISKQTSKDHYFLSYTGKIITHAGAQPSMNTLSKLSGRDRPRFPAKSQSQLK